MSASALRARSKARVAPALNANRRPSHGRVLRTTSCCGAAVCSPGPSTERAPQVSASKRFPGTWEAEVSLARMHRWKLKQALTSLASQTSNRPTGEAPWNREARLLRAGGSGQRAADLDPSRRLDRKAAPRGPGASPVPHTLQRRPPGLSGQRANSASPLPGCGEGAEGVGLPQPAINEEGQARSARLACPSLSLHKPLVRLEPRLAHDPQRATLLHGRSMISRPERKGHALLGQS